MRVLHVRISEVPDGGESRSLWLVCVLQALLDWLYKVEPTLSEDLPLHGDIDTVNSLQEEHKAFQQELGTCFSAS